MCKNIDFFFTYNMDLRSVVNRQVLANNRHLPLIKPSEMKFMVDGLKLTEKISDYDRTATLALLLAEESDDSSAVLMAKSLVLAIRNQYNPMYSLKAIHARWMQISAERVIMANKLKQPMTKIESIGIDEVNNIMQVKHAKLIRDHGHWLIAGQLAHKLPPIIGHFILVDDQHILNAAWQTDPALTSFFETARANRKWLKFAWRCETKWYKAEQAREQKWYHMLDRLANHSYYERKKHAKRWLDQLECKQWSIPDELRFEYAIAIEKHRYRHFLYLKQQVFEWECLV